jgi:hypothetical protein
MMVDRTSKPVDAESLTAAFNHMVSGHSMPDDPHSADSLDLGRDTLHDMALSQETIAAVEVLAEYVAGDYQFTGKASEIVRRIAAGQI